LDFIKFGVWGIPLSLYINNNNQGQYLVLAIILDPNDVLLPEEAEKKYFAG
jgi:hypothetical protein